MKLIRRGDDTEIVRRSSVASGSVDPELVPGSEVGRTQADEDEEVAHLNKVAKIARGLTVFMTLALLVLWPMPMYGSKYVFSKNFFTGKSCFISYISTNTDFCRLGRGWHHVVAIQRLLCRYLPCLARTKDHGTYHQVDVP